METTALPSRISRVDLRFRHWAEDVPQPGAPGLGAQKEEGPSQEDADEPLLIREQKGREIMGQAHRLFHRRAAQASNTLTVNVEVVATLDASGNVVGQETVTPSIPSVPAVPTASLPSVPSVPAFPSDLTVPAYPWPSGVPSASAQAIPSSQTVISVSATTTVAGSSSLHATPFPSSSGYNSTISSTVISSTTLTSHNTTSTTLSTPSSSRSSVSSTRTSTSSTALTGYASSSAAASSAAGGGGGFNPANTAAPPAASSAAAAANDQSDSGALGTPQVVGTVFGSLAGAALLLALILFLLRRHKQQQRNTLQITGDDADNQPMTQTAARGSFVAPSFLNRFSGASRSTAESSTGERGFQRISGRKLPSAFSEGMTSEQFARGEGTLSGSSFYKDEKGIYGGPGIIPKDFAKETGEPSNTGTVGTKERVMPSPARTPVIHHPDDAPPFGTSRNGGGSTLSPPLTPNPDVPARGTLGRSHPSHDGSRTSKFSENV